MRKHGYPENEKCYHNNQQLCKNYEIVFKNFSLRENMQIVYIVFPKLYIQMMDDLVVAKV